jgi:hypothetical protein
MKRWKSSDVWWAEKDLGWNSHGVYSGIFLDALNKTIKILSQDSYVSTEIWTVYLQNLDALLFRQPV